MLKVVLSTILGVTHGLDLGDILNADVTCCPQHAASETGCDAEAGTSCEWIGSSDDPFDQALAAAEGNCLGAKFYACKKDAGNVDACCKPGCPGIPPAPAPAPGEPPKGPGYIPDFCGPAPTPPPTPACELGVNYAFEGRQCIISGDPHTYLPNGDRHDFQGTPAINFGTDADPVLKNQFFYFHPCNGANLDQIPIKVLGTHYHWGTRSVSGIDYLTVILTDNTGEYNLFLSSALHASGSGVSTNYDNNDPADMVSLTSGSTTHIGTRFKVYYVQIEHLKKIWVKITVDDTEEFTIYMAGQTSFVNGRYRMHYVQISPPSSMKCHACGLCGDYKRPMTGLSVEQLEACDGTLVDYRAGWNPTYTPEAYDADGWTWEYNFVMNDCSAYDITDNIPAEANPTDPCPKGSAISKQVADACLAAKEAKEAEGCCDGVGTLCEDQLKSCRVDACVGADGDVTAIDDQVQAAFTDPIDDVCNNDDLNDGMDEAPEPDLKCPAGSVVATGDGNYNDIRGCGMTSCTDRYDIGCMEDCQRLCRSTKGCKGFTYAPKNGDRNHKDNTVCTIYDSDTPTSNWSPNQIFCALRPTTCSLKSYNFGDDDTYISLSQDGGKTFSDYYSSLGWNKLVSTEIRGITMDTVVRYKVVNSGSGPGGFAAAIELYQDQDMSVKTTIVTQNPLSNFKIVDTTSTDRNNLYYEFGKSPVGGWNTYFNTDKYPQFTGAYINNIDPLDYSTYELDFSRQKKALDLVGCFDELPPETTCSVASYSVGDDDTYIQLSQDGGQSFTEIKANQGWPTGVAVNVAGVTSNTILKYTVVNSGGGPGGFAATLKLNQDQDTTQTAQIVTDNPLTNFEIVNSETTSSITGTRGSYFGASGIWDSRWNTVNHPQMSSDAYINQDIDAHKQTTFQLDFSRHKSTLNVVGCGRASAQFQHVTTENFNGQEIEIGWIEYIQCDEGDNPIRYPSGTQSEMQEMAKNAVTVKVLDRDDFPGSENLEYSVTADLCSNPVYALSLGKELSFNLDTSTGKINGYQNVNNWIGTSNAKARMWNSCYGGLNVGSSPRDIASVFYHACNNVQGLHLTPNKCEYDWRTATTAEGVSVWFGFTKSKTGCTSYTAKAKQQLLVHEGVMMKELEGNVDNTLLISGSIGVVLLICVFGLWFRNKNKGKEYMPLKDDTLSTCTSYSSMYNQV